MVLFFPCNQFCDEEPGSAAEIKAFYVDEHGLPAACLMERGDVNGDDTQDVYQFLRSAQLPNQTNAEPIEWNFSTNRAPTSAYRIILQTHYRTSLPMTR